MNASKIRSKIENYWYHYKWQTIIVAGFVVIIAVLIVQFAHRDSYDAEVIYAGNANLTPNQVTEIQSAFSLCLTGDRDGDGKKSVQLYSFYLPTAAQIKELESQAVEEDILYVPNNAQISETRAAFTNQIYVGEALVCLLDPEWYALVLENNGFVPLGEIFGRQAEGYAVRQILLIGFCVSAGRYAALLQADALDDSAENKKDRRGTVRIQ